MDAKSWGSQARLQEFTKLRNGAVENFIDRQLPGLGDFTGLQRHNHVGTTVFDKRPATSDHNRQNYLVKENEYGKL